jgi:hypothetical protein
MAGRQMMKRKLYPAIAIIGEGITESIYFSQMRQQEDMQFTVKPDYGKNSGIESIIAKAIDLLDKEFDTVFCVIDMDEMHRDQKLMEKYEKLKKEHGSEQLVFIETNPCTEFWFLLHYEYTTKLFHNYRQLETLLKKHIPGYKKTEKFLAGNNIYNYLKPKQTNARNNAQKIPLANSGSSHSDIYKILDYLGIKKD